MSRKNVSKKKNVILTRKVFSNKMVELLFYKIMQKGKKSLAYKILLETMIILKKRTHLNPLVILHQAIKHVAPRVIVKSKRVSGSIYQTPLKIRKKKSFYLAIQWLLTAAKEESGANMVWHLSSELISAARKTGNAVRKREDIHRLAKANRAYAYRRGRGRGRSQGG